MWWERLFTPGPSGCIVYLIGMFFILIVYLLFTFAGQLLKNPCDGTALVACGILLAVICGLIFGPPKR